MTKDAVLVKLELRNSVGQLVSDNLYWLGATSASYLARVLHRQLCLTAAKGEPGCGYRISGFGKRGRTAGEPTGMDVSADDGADFEGHRTTLVRTVDEGD
jgi:hypothetical protein